MSIDTYYALIHLWETAGIIARNFEQFTEQVKLALMELNIQIFDVLTHDIDDIFNRLFPRFVMNSDGAIEKVVMYNDELLFAGTKKQFNEFAAKIGEAAKKGREELKRVLNQYAADLNIKYKEFLDNKGWKVSKTSGNGTQLEILDNVSGNVLFRGSEDLVEKYIKFRKLPIQERNELMRRVYKRLRNNPNAYNLETSLKKLKEIGYDLEIPKTKGGIGLGNGMSPDFSVLFDEMFMINNKLGNGAYDEITDFSLNQIKDALSKIIKNKGEIKVSITGNRASDFANCWRAMGIDNDLGKLLLSKLELTWHHLDNLSLEMEGTLQLVIRDVHKATVLHVGSHKQIEEVLKLIN